MIGKTISHYKILEKLGEGGMGEVYLAEDTKLERKVALKFLPQHLTTDKEAVERFQREAKAAAALNHPNIITIYEISEFDGQIFIAMEYVAGISLAQQISKSTVSINDTLNIALQICEGMNKAHGAGIIHRDIKPANILIDADGRVKIVDFGVAKLKGVGKLTKETSTLGTIQYMSPEQARGEDVDFCTDIWSIGVLLYEMSTSRLPFIEEYEAALIYSIINESPLPPTELNDSIPTELEKIILKCLRKEKQHRYQSAKNLLSDLNKVEKVLREAKHEAIAVPKEKPEIKKETERRQATVMFAEISGYNEMLEKMDAEEAASTISTCIETFGVIAEKYGGKVNKIMGCNFEILFGVPEAIEDAPKEAVNTAIEVRNRLYALNQEKKVPIPLDIHIGINTGTVIAGAMGTDEKREFTVMGDTMTLASQLKDLSANGQIYVGPSTYRYTRSEFDYKPLKPITLKGKTKAVRIYELLSTREKIYRPEFASERMIYSEMVGRDKELNKLKLQVLKVINGEGSIVSVIGEAGIGKSRLIIELRKIEDIKKVTLLEGRALSIGKNLSYHPIIDILKGWASIKDEDSEIESLTKLEHFITNTHPEEAREIFPFVATLMGMKLRGKHAERVKGIEGEAMEKLILKNMRELIIKIAEQRPIVCIIHDIHWADMSSIELLESLYRLAEKHSILFINVMRPNYPETGERILETIRERYSTIHSEIYLEPLDEKQCEILIQNLIKVSELPTNIRATITSRAEGNPFFIEEVVRSFIDEGAIEIQDGKFKVTEKIDSVVIPGTIQDVLMARIDRLDETTKSLLKQASVIGRYFFYKILAEIARTIDDIDDRLDYLKGIELIRERMRLEEIEYLFKHAFAQEVTYDSILFKKRKELHLQVADAIEKVFSERLHEFYGMLALHYSRGENLEKAEEYLIKAGEEALKAAASNEALNYYQEALKLYLKKSGDAADPDKIAILDKNIALAFYNKGHMVEAVKYFDKVLEYWGERRPKNKFMAQLNLIANMLSVMKNLYFPSKRAKKVPDKRDNEIINLSEKRGTALTAVYTNRFFMDSIGTLRKLNKLDITKVENGSSIYTISSALFSFTGISFKISRKILDYTKKYTNKNDIKSAIVYNLSRLIHNFFSGNWNKKFEYDENFVNRSLNIGEVFYAASYSILGGLLKIEQGDFSNAQRIAGKSSKIGENYENEIAIGNTYVINTKLLLKCRKLYDAKNEVDAGISFLNRSGQNVWDLSGVKPHIQILLNDIGGAENSLLQVKEFISHEKRVVPYHISSLLMSQLLFDLYKLEESINSNDKSKTSQFRKKAYHSGKAAVKNSMRFAADRTEAFKLMGSYYWLIAKQKKALAWWDKSIKVGENLGARPELARTYMEVGKKLLEKKSKFQQLNGIQAEEYLEKARVLFQEMELEWDLEELERVGRSAWSVW